MLAFNAYSASNDTAHWPVAGEGIYNSIFKMYDPQHAGIQVTLWVSAYCVQAGQVAFAHQLLMHLESADSIDKAVGNVLDRNRQVVHAQLDVRIDGDEKLRAWGWVQDDKIFTLVDNK